MKYKKFFKKRFDKDEFIHYNLIQEREIVMLKQLNRQHHHNNLHL